MQELFDFVSKYVILNEEEKEAIIALDIFREVKKGQLLLEAGQRSSNCYFVLKGCLRTYYLIDGEEKTTAFYTEMQALTPTCVTHKTTSPYYVACVEDSLISVSNTEMELATFRQYPKFETLCRIMTEEYLAKEQLEFDEFKYSSPEQRYLNLLQNRAELFQRVPQHQIASYLGISPQSLSRLKARLLKRP